MTAAAPAGVCMAVVELQNTTIKQVTENVNQDKKTWQDTTQHRKKEDNERQKRPQMTTNQTRQGKTKVKTRRPDKTRQDRHDVFP
jgi:hypothetical protein